MNEITLFQKNATVFSAEGKKIGSLQRVVLHPDTKVVTDIIVRTGNLFATEDRVVPIHLVAETNESQIVLEDQAGELQFFPHFEVARLIEVPANSNQHNDADPSLVFGYPQFGRLVSQPANEQLISETEQNSPEGTVALREGAKVVTAEGKYIGNVERILADSSVSQITHFVISTGALIKANKLIPVGWVSGMSENEIHLRVDKKSIEELETTPIAG